MDPMTICLVAICVILVLGYVYISRNYNYWIERKVTFEKPQFFFGIMYDFTFGKRHICDIVDDIYWKYSDSPLVGMFCYSTPSLIVRDPEMISDVLIKSFNSFHDNDVAEEIDPVLKYNPFVLRGDKWKKTRSRLTLGFTSAKIRCLIPSMKQVCNDLVGYISKQSGPIDAKELCAKYTSDIVALTVCGVNGNSFMVEDPEFRRMSKKLFGNDSIISHLTLFIAFFFPKLGQLFQIRLVPKDVEKYFKGLIKDAIKYRESNSIKRNDFLQLMMSIEETNEDFNEDELLSHVISFFTDGIETSATAISFTIYLLALTPEKQALAQEEIDRVWEKHGDLVPDALGELRYLENCFFEAMRIFPPGGFLRKLCTKKHEFNLQDGNTLTTEPNLNIYIPIKSLHHDPNYFHDPLSFIPERHEEEQKTDLYRKTFLPFGEGPRICIGNRFALAQSKIGLAYILRHFNIISLKETPKKIKMHPRQIVTTSKEILYVGFQRRR